MKLSKKLLVAPLIAILYVGGLFVLAPPSEAFITGPRWASASTEWVSGFQNGVATAGFPANTWAWLDFASRSWSQGNTGVRFNIINFTGLIGPVRTYINPASFSASGIADVPGVTFTFGGATISWASLYLNSDWNWNTGCFLHQGLRWADVGTIALHEMGHLVNLQHDPAHPEAVMWPDFRCKWFLAADDVNGVDALY